MTDEPWWVSAPRWAVAVAAIPGIGAIVMGLYDKRTTRKNESDKSHLAAEALEAEIELKTRAQLSSEQTAMFDRMRSENDRLSARVIELERDRNRGWNIAREWYERAHKMRHAAANTITALVGQLRAKGVKANDADMTLPRLPGFEEVEGIASGKGTL